MAQKVVLRPKPGASPGWPGFFGWLAATHPELHALALAHLPGQVGNWTTGIGSPGSHLMGLGGIFGHNTGLAGLGDDNSSDPGLTAIAPVDLSQLFTLSTQASTEGATNSVPAATTTFSDTIANTIKTLGQTVLPLIQQKKILDVQLARAQAGQPPLDTSAFGMNFGLTGSTQKTFLYIAGIGGLALLAHSFLKGRRRA